LPEPSCRRSPRAHRVQLQLQAGQHLHRLRAFLVGFAQVAAAQIALSLMPDSLIT
jgi:hypothetical protein